MAAFCIYLVAGMLTDFDQFRRVSFILKARSGYSSTRFLDSLMSLSRLYNSYFFAETIIFQFLSRIAVPSFGSYPQKSCQSGKSAWSSMRSAMLVPSKFRSLGTAIDAKSMMVGKRSIAIVVASVVVPAVDD